MTDATGDQPTVRRAANGVDWNVLPDWEGTLFGPAGLLLSEWRDAGAVRLIKQASHRTVLRVDLPDRSFFVKHYHCQDALSAGRHILQGTAARREYNNALELARRNIPTVRPVAVGERRLAGMAHDNYLVTEAIAGAFVLGEYLAASANAASANRTSSARGDGRRLRQETVLALARLCAATHTHGVSHEDFHEGNVLVRPGTAPGEPCELFLIDVPSVRLSAPLQWRASRDNLAILVASCTSLLTRAELARLGKEYLARRPELAAPPWRIAARQVAARAAHHLRTIAAGRDRRALRTNKHFYVQDGLRRRGHAVRGFPAHALEQLLADPSLPLRSNLHQTVKLSHSSVVVRAALPSEGGTVAVAYKRVRGRTWWKALMMNLRRSRALASWRMGHALLSRGIATARPLAVCEPLGFSKSPQAWLATEWLEGALNLHLYGWQLAAAEAGERRRRTWQIADSLGRLIGRMHAWRVSHRDLKGCNLVVVERPERVDCYLIDLDGVRLGRRLPEWTRFRDLARLAVSVELHGWLGWSDRLRFLRAYLQSAGMLGDWKQVWRRLSARARSQRRRQERKRKPLA